MRALDNWLLIALIAAVSLAQLGWTAFGGSSPAGTARPGLPSCILALGLRAAQPIGFECNAVLGYCKVTADIACGAVGPVPYIK